MQKEKCSKVLMISQKNVVLNMINSGEFPAITFMKGRKYSMKDLIDMQLILPEETASCGIYDNYPLAYAYVPYQKYEVPYSKEKALERGTAFASLDKPLGVYGREFNTNEGVRKSW